MIFKAQHWSEIKGEELAEWQALAPNFSPRELASHGDGSILVVKDALKALQRVRDAANRPLTINSGYRDPAYNASIGGVPNSQHTRGRAFDILIHNSQEGRDLERIAKDCGFTAIGRYDTFIHIDNRPPKANGGGYTWGTWK